MRLAAASGRPSADGGGDRWVTSGCRNEERGGGRSQDADIFISGGNLTPSIMVGVLMYIFAFLFVTVGIFNLIMATCLVA